LSVAPCPACGEAATSPWRVAHEVVGGQVTEGGWILRRCPACGTASLPDQDSIAARPDLYVSGLYAPSRGAGDRLLEPVRRLMDRERLRLLGPLPAAARVIDVGAGRGRLVAALRARGHDAVGIEPSRASSAAAVAQGLPVESLAVEDASFPPGSADLVIFWHVLEHLDQPGEALARVRPWVKDGGRLVIAVPNLDSLQAEIGEDRWFHQDVPRHRAHFTVSGLTALLRRSDFAPTRIRHLMIEQNWLGMWLTLLNGLTVDRDVPFRFVKRDLRYRTRGEKVRDAFVSVVVGIPAMLAAAALEFGAALAQRGGTVVVHASPQLR
jgi:SAM-dependent methyltransferase